jgi:hypothetical protein
VYDYTAGKSDWLANGLPSGGELASEPRIGSLADRDVPTCGLGDRVGDIRGDLCVVVNSAGVILGDLRGKALQAPPETPVEDVMNPAPSTYRPNVSVHQMAHELAGSNAQRVLVSDCGGRLLGLLRREDVEHALHAQHGGGPVLALDANSPSKKEADYERAN